MECSQVFISCLRLAKGRFYAVVVSLSHVNCSCFYQTSELSFMFYLYFLFSIVTKL